MQHRYSDCLRRIAPVLAESVHGYEMLRACARHERMMDRDHAGWDVAEAIYWTASQFYDGQGDPLYSALCATEYEPGTCSRGPDPDSGAAMLAEELRLVFAID